MFWNKKSEGCCEVCGKEIEPWYDLCDKCADEYENADEVI